MDVWLFMARAEVWLVYHTAHGEKMMVTVCVPPGSPRNVRIPLHLHTALRVTHIVLHHMLGVKALQDECVVICGVGMVMNGCLSGLTLE